MKAVMVMFDSLNRHLLGSYGCDWTVTPNFKRLSEKAITFDKSYVCSMPCMPARRDLHTGRPNFLHRSWGPLEPYDDSFVSMLNAAGVHTHIVTDHQHYWEEGAGGNYLTKYKTHEMVRGQEGDPYYAMIPPPPIEGNAIHRNASTADWFSQDRVNRSQVKTHGDMPIVKTFAVGLDFMERHAGQDRWFLQIETFDPHEPFFVLDEHKEAYAEFYEKSRKILWDWPEYDFVGQAADEIELMRHNYASLMTLCDAQLGKVLDMMDAKNLWEDTMLVVWTDHGFTLGEHDCWAKCWLPFYEEVAHTPFFVWDPRSKISGQRRGVLVQPSIDLAPTLLDFFGVEPTPEMTGKALKPAIERDEAVRETALFGQHGFQVNVTDGRHVYMRAPTEENHGSLFEYTLMPAHMRHAFKVEEFDGAELAEPFNFTKGLKLLKLKTNAWGFKPHPGRVKNLLFDLESDPGQERPLNDPDLEGKFCSKILEHFAVLDAPPEQAVRLGLSSSSSAS